MTDRDLDRDLIQRLLSLAEQAVKEALDLEFEDPEDRYIWRELQELKQLARSERVDSDRLIDILFREEEEDRV